ncbi:hypothetical protein NECAME_18541, partial [Necator americanus]
MDVIRSISAVYSIASDCTHQKATNEEHLPSFL